MGLYQAEWGYHYINSKGNVVVRYERFTVSIRPAPIAFSKHEAGAHQYPYLYG